MCTQIFSLYGPAADWSGLYSALGLVTIKNILIVNFLKIND